MGNLRRLVLDVLKPLDPGVVTLVQLLADLEGVDGVNISLSEIDRRVENVKITIEGRSLSYEMIKGVVEENGGAIHSVDEVAAGSLLIEDVATTQD
jgi:hypothetical protein